MPTDGQSNAQNRSDSLRKYFHSTSSSVNNLLPLSLSLFLFFYLSTELQWKPELFSQPHVTLKAPMATEKAHKSYGQSITLSGLEPKFCDDFFENFLLDLVQKQTTKKGERNQTVLSNQETACREFRPFISIVTKPASSNFWAGGWEASIRRRSKRHWNFYC